MFSDGCCTTEYSIFITEAFFKIYLCYVNIDWMPLRRCIFLYANIHVMHAVLTYSRPDFGLFLLFPFWLRVYFYQLPAESLLLFRKFQILGYIHSNHLGSVRKKYLLSCQKWVSSSKNNIEKSENKEQNCHCFLNYSDTIALLKKNLKFAVREKIPYFRLLYSIYWFHEWEFHEWEWKTHHNYKLRHLDTLASTWLPLISPTMQLCINLFPVYYHSLFMRFHTCVPHSCHRNSLVNLSFVCTFLRLLF